MNAQGCNREDAQKCNRGLSHIWKGKVYMHSNAIQTLGDRDATWLDTKATTLCNWIWIMPVTKVKAWTATKQILLDPRHNIVNWRQCNSKKKQHQWLKQDTVQIYSMIQHGKTNASITLTIIEHQHVQVRRQNRVRQCRPSQSQKIEQVQDSSKSNYLSRENHHNDQVEIN